MAEVHVPDGVDALMDALVDANGRFTAFAHSYALEALALAANLPASFADSGAGAELTSLADAIAQAAGLIEADFAKISGGRAEAIERVARHILHQGRSLVDACRSWPDVAERMRAHVPADQEDTRLLLDALEGWFPDLLARAERVCDAAAGVSDESWVAFQMAHRHYVSAYLAWSSVIALEERIQSTSVQPVLDIEKGSGDPELAGAAYFLLAEWARALNATSARVSSRANGALAADRRQLAEAVQDLHEAARGATAALIARLTDAETATPLASQAEALHQEFESWKAGISDVGSVDGGISAGAKAAVHPRSARMPRRPERRVRVRRTKIPENAAAQKALDHLVSLERELTAVPRAAGVTAKLTSLTRLVGLMQGESVLNQIEGDKYFDRGKEKARSAWSAVTRAINVCLDTLGDDRAWQFPGRCIRATAPVFASLDGAFAATAALFESRSRSGWAGERAAAFRYAQGAQRIARKAADVVPLIREVVRGDAAEFGAWEAAMVGWAKEARSWTVLARPNPDADWLSAGSENFELLNRAKHGERFTVSIHREPDRVVLLRPIGQSCADDRFTEGTLIVCKGGPRGVLRQIVAASELRRARGRLDIYGIEDPRLRDSLRIGLELETRGTFSVHFRPGGGGAPLV